MIHGQACERKQAGHHVPTVRELVPPWAAVADIRLCSVAGDEHASGDVKAELVAQQRLVGPALTS